MANKQTPDSFVKKSSQAGIPHNRKPTERMKRAAKLIAENGRAAKPRSKGEIMKEAGYSPTVQAAPSKIIESPTFQQLLDSFMPDEDLAKVHKRLLQTRKIEHMVFPLGPEGEDDPNLSGSKPNADNQIEKAGVKVERTTLTDVEIKEMLAEVNCVVKRIVHGDTARHVYFWAHDANAQAKALDLAYKIKGHAMDGKGGGGDTFNFIAGNTFVKNGEGNS